MASTKSDDDSANEKRIIEFDMFVRDLEPDEEEKIRGGGKSGEQKTSDGHKPERPD